MWILFFIVLPSLSLAAFAAGRSSSIGERARKLESELQAKIRAAQYVKGLTVALVRKSDRAQVGGFDTQQMWYICEACEGTYLVQVSDDVEMILTSYTDQPFDNQPTLLDD